MLGIIGGSGLTAFPELKDKQERVIQTPYGATSSAIIVGSLHDQTVAFLARHGNPHVIAPHSVNYQANIWALHSIGVTAIIAVNAVGGISKQQDTGVISLPHQLIDYTWGRRHSFSNTAGFPLLHIDFTHPYTETLRQTLLQLAYRDQLYVLDSAVYAVTQGPRLETAAEIHRLANEGCDIVGMTAMPEAALARELALDYACIALVVNKAAGLSDELITFNAMEKVMHDGMHQIKHLIAAYCKHLASR